MPNILTLLLIYIIGGVTLLPILIITFCVYSYYTLPRSQIEKGKLKNNVGHGVNGGKDCDTITDQNDDIKCPSHDNNPAAAYFTVCREFFPGGVNFGNSERATIAGATISNESLNVYQSMYRSIFDRNKSQVPIIEGNTAAVKPSKKVRNVFLIVMRYVFNHCDLLLDSNVIRHGHLMLYDDDSQVEVRHVISVAHHDVDIYGGDEILPEGELFVKRNCIRLKANDLHRDRSLGARPYYLFSEDCSKKEDFYHALLQCKEAHSDGFEAKAATLKFYSAHLVKLIQQLHESEQSLQTRWLNALTGRLFLGIYRTRYIEQIIRTKLTRKVSRVQKPTFLGDVEIQEVDMGDCVPIFTNLKLKEVMLDGALVLEADVKYTGNFRLQVATVARLDLGPRFKVRELNLLLAGILKELEGHMLLKIKPPPSNRFWISFETMPKMNISVEPTVSSRHITYGVILRIIENRIREVINETMVLPNWDDTPFFDTSHCNHRGGIFQENINLSGLEKVPREDVNENRKKHNDILPVQENDLLNETDSSFPRNVVSESSTKGLTQDRSRHTRSSLSMDETGNSSEPVSFHAEIPLAKPKVLRSRSFVSSSAPIVDVDVASVQAIKDQSPKGKVDAASTMKEISSRARPLSPQSSFPESSPAKSNSAYVYSKDTTSQESESKEDNDFQPQSSLLQSSTFASQSASQPSTPSLSEPSASMSIKSDSSSLSSKREIDSALSPAGSSASSDKMQIFNHSLNAASSTAKKWGLGMLNRQQVPDAFNTGSGESASNSRSTTRSEPFGRGQPLPPPGTPLPFPPGHEKSKSAWSTISLPSSPLNIAGITRRKAGPSTSILTKLNQRSSGSSTSVKSASLPQRREHLSQQSSENILQATDSHQYDEVLVVAAPDSRSTSHPASSMQEAIKKYGDDVIDNNDNGNEDKDDDDSDSDITNRPTLPSRASVNSATESSQSTTNSSSMAQGESEQSDSRSKFLPIMEDTSLKSTKDSSRGEPSGKKGNTSKSQANDSSTTPSKSPRIRTGKNEKSSPLQDTKSSDNETLRILEEKV